jgi:GNAT superfamily N-acetyltransferase
MYTTNETFHIRPATEADIPDILSFIKELAVYEKLLDEVVATEATLREWLFEKQKAEAFIGEYDGRPVGYAIFFHNFSSFLGRAGIYLEDLYVTPRVRGKGFGKALLKEVARIAVERGCGRLEWTCLDWNQPSIDFYRAMGATPMDDWTIYRVTGERLEQLAQ